MVGLAAMSAIAAMAFLGTAAASASTTDLALCATDGLTCSSPITHVHETDSAVKILNSITTITCSTLFLGDVLTSGGLAKSSKPLVLSGKFSYSGCKTSSGALCEKVEEALGPASFEIAKTAAEEGKVTISFFLEVQCLGIDCIFSNESLVGKAYGALYKEPNGETVSEENALQMLGPFCPTVAKLDMLLKPLSATYISS